MLRASENQSQDHAAAPWTHTSTEQKTLLLSKAPAQQATAFPSPHWGPGPPNVIFTHTSFSVPRDLLANRSLNKRRILQGGAGEEGGEPGWVLHS